MSSRDRRSHHEEEPVPLTKEQETQVTIKALITKVGDNKGPEQLGTNLREMAPILEDYLADHESFILDVLINCVSGLPVKTPIYGTFVGLLNCHSPAFGARVVEIAHNRLQTALHRGWWTQAKLLVRFVCELLNANLLLPHDVVGMLRELLSVTKEEPLQQDRADTFVSLAMLALPWVGKELDDRRPEELARLLTDIEGYVGRRSHAGVMATQIFTSSEDSTTAEREDHVDVLWKQLIHARSEGWTISPIIRVHSMFESQLAETKQHDFPSIQVPAQSQEGLKYAVPRSLFDVIDLSTDGNGPTPSERMILEDYISDTLYFFNPSHRDAAKQLVNLPVPFPIHRLLVQSLFGHLFQLPRPTFRPIYYAVLLLDLYKDATFRAAIEEVAHAIFSRLDALEVECLSRFSDWLAHLLTNAEYAWDWQKWEHVGTLPPSSRQSVFVCEVFDRCVRLSFVENVKKAIPESLHSLLPPSPSPCLKYAGEGEAYHTEYIMLADKVKAKTAWDDMLRFLREEIQPKLVASSGGSEGSSTLNVDALLLDLFANVVLHAGSKSFTHTLVMLERYSRVLTALSPTSRDKEALVRAATSFWRNSGQHTVIIVERLMTYLIVDHRAVMAWAFSDEMLPQYTKGLVWEVLAKAMEKSSSKLEKLQRTIADIESADLPDVERLSQLRPRLEEMTRDQKQMFLDLFQQFVRVLTIHFAKQPATPQEQADHDLWTKLTLARLMEFGRKHRHQIDSLLSTLTDIIFEDADPRILAVFNEFKSVNSQGTYLAGLRAPVPREEGN